MQAQDPMNTVTSGEQALKQPLTSPDTTSVLPAWGTGGHEPPSTTGVFEGSSVFCGGFTGSSGEPQMLLSIPLMELGYSF